MQEIIDRFNEGQERWVGLKNPNLSTDIRILGGVTGHREAEISKYDFLYNPKWGLAHTLWKGDYVWHLQQMVISDDPIQYIKENMK